MKIYDLDKDDIRTGMRIHSPENPGFLGVVTSITHYSTGDMVCRITWEDGRKEEFYDNCCEYEITDLAC